MIPTSENFVVATPSAPHESAGEVVLAYQDNAAWSRLLHAATNLEFFNSWLALQCRTMSQARRGVLVLRDDAAGGKLAPAAHWPERSPPSLVLSEAAARAAEAQQSTICRSSRDKHCSAVAQPIVVRGTVVGIAAVEVLSESQAELTQAMRQLQWGVAWIEKWYGLHQEARPKDIALSTEILNDCLRLGSFDPAAHAVTTRLASALGCEQVALGLAKTRHARLIAISNCKTFNRRSAIVSATERAMAEALSLGKTVVVGRQVSDAIVAPAHETLLARVETAAMSIVTVPVSTGVGRDLMFSFQLPAERATSEFVLYVEALVAPVASLLARYVLDERPVLPRLFKPTRTLAEDSPNSKKAWPVLALLAAAAVTAFFSVFTIPFRVPADARIEGRIQQSMTAPFAGFIAKANVRPGDKVSAGQEMARLDDRDLMLEQNAWTSRRAQYEREMQRSLSEHKLAPVNVLKAQIDEASAQIALIAQKRDRTRINAPFDGLVIDGDLTQTIGRAVQQGDMLYKLAPLDHYRVVIEVDERDIHLIQVGQTGHLVLMSKPDHAVPLTISSITSTTVSAKGRNAFRVEATLDPTDLELRPGMEGLAKVGIGDELAIWIWTRRLSDWIRLQVWSWWP